MRGLHSYIMSHFSLLTTGTLSQNIITCFIHFHMMSEERQQSLKEYPYEVVTHPNTVPPMPHNQPTIPRDCAVTVSSTADVSLWGGALIASGCPRFTLHRKHLR